MTDWMLNGDGYWCPSCGDLIARQKTAEDGFLPEECRQCGFPDAEKVAEYHCGPDDDFDDPDEDDWLDCGLMHDGQCTKAGSEECDWECGRLGA